MRKEENLIRKNKERSDIMVNNAIDEIQRMLNNEELVLVCELVRRTGASRSFFYNNEEVHNALMKAQEVQRGVDFISPKKKVIDKSMEKEIILLKKKLADSEEKIAVQKKTIEKLQKQVKNQSLKLLKDL